MQYHRNQKTSSEEENTTENETDDHRARRSGQALIKMGDAKNNGRYEQGSSQTPLKRGSVEVVQQESAIDDFLTDARRQAHQPPPTALFAGRG